MAKLERTDKPINVIVEERQRGELGLPEIQRGYVWKQAQVRDLIESMYKEYPCGLILFWKPPDEMLDNLQLRDSDIDVENYEGNKKPAFLVLDGQQRITSILKVLDGTIEVYFNVEDEKFEIKSPKIKGNPYWVSVTRVLKEGATKVWRELKEKIGGLEDQKYDMYLDRLSVIQGIKEYRIPVQILHTDDYEEITEAFIRINSRGTKLREAELALARLAFKLPGMVSHNFEDALDEYEENHFEFEARFLIRCFVSIATAQSKYKFLSNLWKLSEPELIDIWNKTKHGVDDTISFLRSNVGIESSDWITSINSLVPLVVCFGKKTQLTPHEERLLLFWYYNSNMWGRYSSSAETKLDQDLDVLVDKETGEIKSNGIENLLINCRKDVADFIVDEPELVEMYQRSSFMSLLFAIVRKRRAKCWLKQHIELSATNVGNENKIEMHHFFPRSNLKKAGLPRKKYDDFSNIVFLSQRGNRLIRNNPPIVYIKELKIPNEYLEAQFIPLDETLWEMKNYDKFLEVRRKMIADAMNTYLSDFAPQFMERQYM